MRLVTINPALIRKFSSDKEMLQKTQRPCALIMRLKYKCRNYTFAVPLRSNISGSAPKETYFPLPPRKTTKSGHRHGLHYIKMFPVDKQSIIRYRTDGNVFAALIKGILDRSEKAIISECQSYLDNYSKGVRYDYSTDIDLLLSLLE